MLKERDRVNPLLPYASLRDLFAGMAMLGHLAAQGEWNGRWKDLDVLAEKSWAIADATMEARKSHGSRDADRQ